LKKEQLDFFATPKVTALPTPLVVPAPTPPVPSPVAKVTSKAAPAPKPVKPKILRKVPAPLNESRATLAEAKSWLQGELERGTTCPCCSQYAKIYQRKINSGMAAALLAIYRRSLQLMPKEGWLHIPDDFQGAGALVSILTNREYPKLRYWGLLQSFEGPNEESETPFSGKWRITTKGKAFCEDRQRVPKYVHLYAGKPLDRQEDATVSIREALGTKFNFDDLMGGK
jgi:hypothetical protein